MKDRGVPHYVGQQMAFLNGQDYNPQTSSNKVADPFNGGARPAMGGQQFVSSGANALASNNNSLNNAQYQSHQLRKKQGLNSTGGASQAMQTLANDQRQLALAEMVKGSIKQPPYPKKETLFSNGNGNPNNQYIKGTQVQKDFQLLAEPLLISKAITHQNNQQSHPMKGTASSSSSNIISYQNSTGSTIQGSSAVSDVYPPVSSGLNPFSQNSSRKNLESYQTAKGHQDQQAVVIQNQALQHLNLQQQSNQTNHYSTNRSVAAKAGQMQIFSNDKYSHLPSSNPTQNPKFHSPGKTHMKAPQHHQSASQQIENMIDLQQQMRLRNNSGQAANGGNQKYTEYLNRFSTQGPSQSIDHTQNLQLKYRDLRNQILEQDTYFNVESSTQDPDQQQQYSNPLNIVSPPPIGLIFNQQQGVGQKPVNPGQMMQLQDKKSPNILTQKENRLDNLGISGESMHLEEKNFLKKLGGVIQGAIAEGGCLTGSNSHRQGGGSSKKRTDQLPLNGRGGFQRSIKQDGQHMVLQSRNRYDYVFVRIGEDVFEREFGDKITFQREVTESSSPSMLSFKPQRISSLASSQIPYGQPMISISGEDNNRKDSDTLQILAPRQQKSVRGSQDMNTPGLFSPNNRNNPQVFTNGLVNSGMEDLLTIQTLSHDTSVRTSQQSATPKMLAANQNQKQLNQCSIISTNHTHIKVITHQTTTTNLSPFQDMAPEISSMQQNALNDCVQDVMLKVQEKGRVVKTTQKKKYILNSLNPAHIRVASIYVLVLDSTLNYVDDPDHLRQTLMSEASNNSSNQFNSTLTKFQNAQGQQKQMYLKRGEITRVDPINAQKIIRMRNNSTMNSKIAGYESESEVKSTNSTTTSSTLQHFIPTRNFDQANVATSGAGIKPTRSLSQKGVPQPRKNFQKPAAEESQTLVVQKADGNTKKYPPTKIKIISPFDQAQSDSHRINVCLNNYNNFIQQCFKQKGKANVAGVVKLGKQLGIPISANMFTDGIIKSREQANLLKEKLIAYLCKSINDENHPEDMPENQLIQEAIIPLVQPVHQYKCYVGKGNNSILIRTLFKTRFWWLLHDKEEIEKVNFMWTQLRKNPIMDTFPCKFEDKKSGLRTQGGNASGNSSAMQTPGKLKQKKKMSMINSSLSLDSSGSTNQGTNSNDKKDLKVADKDYVATNVLSPALQQLSVKLYNKLEDNFHLSNKKAMFLNIRLYYEAIGKDVFNAVPMTFHIKEGLDDPEFHRFKQHYFKEEEEIKKQKQLRAQIIQMNQAAALADTDADGSEAPVPKTLPNNKRNIWIIKPGENTNRGQGITVMKEFEEIKAIVQESTANKKRTCIVQKYIHNPLLINKRKFDIRLYAFLSSVNGNLKGYFYQDGYLRTSCREFTLQNLSNRMIHLTNDAVQKNAEDYGKFEAGNKLSYNDFQNYLDKNYGDLNICFERDLLPQMKRLVTDMFRSVYGKIDPKRRINTVEIYGYDFMFDDDFKVYLIEVNTNPCLELGCPLLARLIPTMVENALRLTVDPLFPAPENWSQKKCVVNDICPENKFELIFDEKVDGPYLTELMKEKNNIIIEIDEEELSDNDVIEKDECEMAI